MNHDSLLNEILRWDNKSPSYLFDSSNENDNRFALEETYLTPFWDYCKHRVEVATRQCQYFEYFNQGAFFQWKAQFMTQLAQWTSRIMRRALEGEPGYTARTAFLEAATERLFLSDPVKAWGGIFGEYPALKFIFPRIIEDFIVHALEVMERIVRHAGDVSDAFFGGGARRVASVGTGISDLHNRGRSVHVLTFEGGEKLVYKPRDMRVDLAWNALLDEMARLGGVAPFFTPRVMSFDDYAFVEFVEARPVKTEREAAGFFFRSGYLMCLVFALGGFDLHAENIIAHGNCPVIVDVETVIAVPGHKNLEKNSVTGTQFLPYLSVSKTLEKGYPCLTAVLNKSLNLPVLNGETRTAFDYTAEVEDGFSACYETIVRNLDYMLGVESPINAFIGRRVRFLKKDTGMYMKTIDVLSTLKNFTFSDEAAMIKKIDRLVGYEDDEERELRYGYIPSFYQTIDTLDNIFMNLRNFTEERKREQTVIIRTVLGKNGSGFLEDLTGEDACLEPYGKDEIRRFISEKAGAWIKLLDGTYFNGKPLPGIISERTDKRFYVAKQQLFFLETLLGIAVVMAAWHRVSGDASAKRCLDAYLAQMSKELEYCPLRVFTPCMLEGASGVALAMARIYELTGAEQSLAICADAAEALDIIKPKMLFKNKDWADPLFYGEMGTVFAYASLPETLRRDSHEKSIDTLISRYKNFGYDYTPAKSGVSPLLSLSLIRALNRSGGMDIPLSDGLETYDNYKFNSNDTFCYGNAGALAAMLDKRAAVSGSDERVGLHQKALKLAGRITAKAERDGGFGLIANRGLPFPGFFHGEAGILYSLIRTLSPDIIPQLF